MKLSIVHLISRYRSAFFSIALLVLLASCNPDDETLVSEPVEVAYVSIYHAAPNAPAFDITVDGRQINFNPLEYTAYSGYLNFFTGERALTFRAANADNSLIDTTFNFQDGKAYSLFAIDRIGSLEALLVVDSAGTPSTGKAMVRFINLAPDAPAYDLTLGGSETPLFVDKGFKGYTTFKEVEAGNLTVEVRSTGGSEAVLSAEDVEILPGRFYTIATRGFVNPPAGNNHVLSLEVIE